MLKIGLTGGIASGKTMVSNHFAHLGAPVIDTDQISRELVEPGKPALADIQNQFGARFLLADGSLNRRLLREHIFTDAAAKAALEAILHPAIRTETKRRLSRIKNEPYAILVVPLLVENNLDAMVDRVLLLDVPESLQIQRVCQRDGGSKEQAKRILAAQAPREARRNIADDIILNTGTLQDLHRQVEKLHEHYLSLGSRSD
ncbi:dephospho-CoA kinase [Thiolapillus sp.]